jgi:hypothetical protein
MAGADEENHDIGMRIFLGAFTFSMPITTVNHVRYLRIWSEGVSSIQRQIMRRRSATNPVKPQSRNHSGASKPPWKEAGPFH